MKYLMSLIVFILFLGCQVQPNDRPYRNINIENATNIFQYVIINDIYLGFEPFEKKIFSFQENKLDINYHNNPKELYYFDVTISLDEVGISLH